MTCDHLPSKIFKSYHDALWGSFRLHLNHEIRRIHCDTTDVWLLIIKGMS